MAKAISLEQAEWLDRVLGVRLGGATAASAAVPAAPDGAAAGLIATAGKLAAAARPAQPPRTQSTDALLATARTTRLPEDDLALPDFLVTNAPRFLTAIVDEPATSAQSLAVGASLPAQDQLLGLSDQLDAIGRAMQAWEALLDQAEAADAALGPAGSDADADAEDADKAKAVAAYNALRAAAARAQERTQELAATLRGGCNGLVGTAGKAV